MKAASARSCGRQGPLGESALTNAITRDAAAPALGGMRWSSKPLPVRRPLSLPRADLGGGAEGVSAVAAEGVPERHAEAQPGGAGSGLVRERRGAAVSSAQGARRNCSCCCAAAVQFPEHPVRASVSLAPAMIPRSCAHQSFIFLPMMTSSAL